MTWELLLLIGAITFASRAVSVALLPPLPDRFRHVVDRMPAAIFAGLAARELVLPGTGLADLHTLAAAAGALILTPRRSLLVCLVGGLIGYVVGDLALRIL
jgi:branched-subunit amino acid transport protein